MTEKKNGMALAAMVLGIISLALFWTGWLGLICGILAIIFGIVAKNKIKADPDLAPTAGKAKGGLIMGIIGSVLAIVWIVLLVMAVNAATSNFEDSMSDWEDAMDQLDNN